MKKAPSKRALSAFIILFVTLFVLFGGFRILSNGITIDNLRFADIQVRGLYLKLNNKFILEIKELDLIQAMSKKSSKTDTKNGAKPDNALDFEQINNYIKYATWGLAYFENLRIEKIALSDEHVASIIYDGEHYSLSFPKIQAIFDVQNTDNAIALMIKRLQISSPDTQIAGKIIYSNANKQLSFALSLSPLIAPDSNAHTSDNSGAESAKNPAKVAAKSAKKNEPITIYLQGSSDFKRVLMRAKTSKIANLAFARDLVSEYASGVLPALDKWLFHALDFEHAQIESASFDVTLTQKRFMKTLLENTKLTLAVKNPAYKIDPTLTPFSAKSAKLSVQKAQALLELDEPELESIPLQGSKLAFSLMDSVPTLSILAHSDSLLYTDALRGLLGFYGVKLPIERVMADMKADLAITIPFAQEIHVGFDGRLNADNAVLSASGLDFTTKSASVEIKINPKTQTNAIDIWTQNLSYENLFDIDTKTHVNLAEKRLHTSLFVHSLRVSTNPDINQKLIKPKNADSGKVDSGGADSSGARESSGGSSGVDSGTGAGVDSGVDSGALDSSSADSPQNLAPQSPQANTTPERELASALAQIFTPQGLESQVRTYKPAPGELTQLARTEPFSKPSTLATLARYVAVQSDLPQSAQAPSEQQAEQNAKQADKPIIDEQVVVEKGVRNEPLRSPTKPTITNTANPPVSSTPSSNALDSRALDSASPKPLDPAPAQIAPITPDTAPVEIISAPGALAPESSPSDPATPAASPITAPTIAPATPQAQNPTEPLTPLKKPDVSLAPQETIIDHGDPIQTRLNDLEEEQEAPNTQAESSQDPTTSPKLDSAPATESNTAPSTEVIAAPGADLDSNAELTSAPESTTESSADSTLPANPLDSLQADPEQADPTQENSPQAPKIHQKKGIELDFTRPMSEQEKQEKIIALLKYQDEQKFTYDIFNATQDSLPQIDIDIDFAQEPMRISIPALDVYMQIFAHEIQANILNFAKFAPFSPIMQYLGLSSGSANVLLKSARDISFKIHIDDYPSFLLAKDKSIVKDFTFNGRYANDKLQVRSDDGLIGLDLYDGTTLAHFKDLDVSIDGLLESKIPAIQEAFSTSSEKKAVFTSEQILHESEFLRAKRRYERANNIKPKIIAIEAQNVTGFFKEVTIPLDDFNAKIRDDRISADATYKNGIANIDIIHGNTIIKAGNFSGEFLNRVIGKQIVNGGLFELSGIYKNDIFNGDIHMQNTSFKGFAIVQNVIGLIDTIPSLVMFRSPALSTKGYEVKKGNIKLSLNTQYVGLESIHLVGKSMDIEGNGFIELDTQEVDMGLSISTLKNLSGILNKIPIVGYLLLGKDGKVTTQVSLRGTLQDPKTQISLAQDILKTPLNVLKRAFKPVDMVIDEIIKSIER